MSSQALILILIFVGNTAATVSDSQTSSITSSGIIITTQDVQLLYEATAPIIYSFELPNWDNFFSLNITDNCFNTSYTQFCDIIDQIVAISKEIHLAVEPPSFHAFEEATTSSTWGLKCHNLGQHFSSFYVDSSIIAKYLGFLRGCSQGVILEEALNSEYALQPTLTYFADAETIFVNEFLNDLVPSIRKGIHLNFLNTLLSTGLTTFLSQAMRWTTAIYNCKLGTIPDTLVTPNMFYESLLKLNATIAQAGWGPVVNFTQEFLPFYFKNKLVDCTFSDNIFYIRVLVPLVKASHSWSHITTRSIPYNHHDMVGNFEGVYRTTGSISGSYFYEEGSKRLFKSQNCNTGHPEFCRLPEMWDQSLLINEPSCIRDILEGFENSTNCVGGISANIRKVPHLPLIVSEGTDIYYLTGVPELKMTVKCQEPDGSEIVGEYSFPQEKGALRVQLPCYCAISIGDNVDIRAAAPCQVLNDKLNVTEVWHQDFI